MRALIIQHEEDAPGGHVSAWLEERGASQDVYMVTADARALGDPNPHDYDLVVSLGSEHAAYDDTLPWVAREVALLRDVFAADVPIIGICFGSQILARALGGQALPGRLTEIGWVRIDSDDPALIADGPWFQWHHDTFAPPADAELLATSPAGPQAYTIGRSLGVQFHPEVTIPIVGGWVAQGGGDLARNGVDPARLMAETRERVAENRVRAWRLFDAFLSRVAAISPTA
jgi:GMP synthase-like glutamine amidotransferase